MFYKKSSFYKAVVVAFILTIITCYLFPSVDYRIASIVWGSLATFFFHDDDHRRRGGKKPKRTPEWLKSMTERKMEWIGA